MRSHFESLMLLILYLMKSGALKSGEICITSGKREGIVGRFVLTVE